MKNKSAFFQPEEVHFFKEWMEKSYNKEDANHIAAKNKLLDTVWAKTKYWSNCLIKELDGFETFNWRMWGQQGWDNNEGENKQVSKFKPYTWARIYRKGDKKKEIFFTIGIDAKDLCILYKLDFYRVEGGDMTKEQKTLCDSHIPQDLKWRAIPISEFQNYSWEKLIAESKAFIQENAHVYDKLIKIVWEGQDIEHTFQNGLIKTDPPSNKDKAIPPTPPFQNDKEKDYIEDAKRKKILGDLGEKLVIKEEKEFLIKNNRPDLAKQVEKKPDREGYDIFSYDLEGNEKHIEVKTTSRNKYSPFYLTRNEWTFAQKPTSNYFIYRLYDYKTKTNSASYYIIENAIDHLILEPILYQVNYK